MGREGERDKQLEEEKLTGAMSGRGVRLTAVVVAAAVTMTSTMVPGEKVRKENRKGGFDVPFQSSRDASAAASFLARVDPDIPV
jgi:hypothetical protein